MADLKSGMNAEIQMLLAKIEGQEKTLKSIKNSLKKAKKSEDLDEKRDTILEVKRILKAIY